MGLGYPTGYLTLDKVQVVSTPPLIFMYKNEKNTLVCGGGGVRTRVSTTHF